MLRTPPPRFCGRIADALRRRQREKKHPILKNTGFADRIKTAAAAKKVQLQKFTPKPAMPDPAFVSRQERRAATLTGVREARAEERAATVQARAEARAASLAAVAAADLAALEMKRLERKTRKQAQKADVASRRQDRLDALQLYARAGIGARAPS